jgi:hypothetical protein
MLGDKPKVPFSASVTAETDAQIEAWSNLLPAEPKRPGVIVDRLVIHGKATGFKNKVRAGK